MDPKDCPIMFGTIRTSCEAKGSLTLFTKSVKLEVTRDQLTRLHVFFCFLTMKGRQIIICMDLNSPKTKSEAKDYRVSV